MTAKGKVNASKVQAGDRIIVRPLESDFREGTITPSATKTGEGVHVARVVGKSFRAAQGPYEARGKYVIETTAGTFEATPIQTMWLAPEDAAGVKRAHAEALAENIARTASQAPAGQAEKDAQISDWLDAHGIALGALTVSEATRVAKAYHAAIAKDRVEAEAEDARRNGLPRADAGIRVRGERHAVSVRSKNLPVVCATIPGLKWSLCSRPIMDDIRGTAAYEFVTCVRCSAVLAEQETPDRVYRVNFRDGLGIASASEVGPIMVDVPFSMRQQAGPWIMKKVHRVASTVLVSRGWTVEVDMIQGRVFIDGGGGRYGEGIITRIR